MTRRDNGLPGDEWQLLADLAPGLADEALDALRDAGIAAYAAPADDDALDQVFVGRDEVMRARDVVERALPHADHREVAERERVAPNVSTDDDVWAGIIAAYSAPAADTSGRMATTDEPDVAMTGETAPAPSGSGVSGFEDIEAEVAAARAESEAIGPPADDPHDHYVPPSRRRSRPATP